MPDPCVAEFIDGQWTYQDCGCEECRQQEADAMDVEYEDEADTEVTS